jgi:predicted RNase H-like HicB family nuclease
MSELEKTAYFIGNLDRPELNLRSPIPIYVEAAGEQFVAYSPDLEEFAVGLDHQSAIDELKESIIAVYFILKKDQSRLGPIQQNHWDYLRRIILET